MTGYELDPRSVALIAAFASWGAGTFSVGYTDDTFPGLVVWLATVTLDPRQVERAGHDPTVPVHRFGSGPTPDAAIADVAEKLVDGAACAHCGRPVAVELDHGATWPPAFCAYQYDPELDRIRRGCA